MQMAKNTTRMQWFTIILVAFIIFYLVLPKLNQAPVEQAATALKKGAPFIDVRTSREFSQQSIPGSKNFPMAHLVEDMQQAGYAKDEPILLFCLSGTRSATALRQLKSAGYTNVMNIGSISRAQKVLELSQQ